MKFKDWFVEYFLFSSRKPKPVNPLMMNWLKKANKSGDSADKKTESGDSLPEAKRMKKEETE